MVVTSYTGGQIASVTAAATFLFCQYFLQIVFYIHPLAGEKSFFLRLGDKMYVLIMQENMLFFDEIIPLAKNLHCRRAGRDKSPLWIGVD